MVEFHVLRCADCNTFQVLQVTKTSKWKCKMCGQKQSVIKVYGQGSGADCRRHVQKLNSLQLQAAWEVDEKCLVSSPQTSLSLGLVPASQASVFSHPVHIHQTKSMSAQGSRWSHYIDESIDKVDVSLVEEEEDDKSEITCTIKTDWTEHRKNKTAWNKRTDRSTRFSPPARYKSRKISHEQNIYGDRDNWRPEYPSSDDQFWNNQVDQPRNSTPNQRCNDKAHQSLNLTPNQCWNNQADQLPNSAPREHHINNTDSVKSAGNISCSFFKSQVFSSNKHNHSSSTLPTSGNVCNYTNMFLPKTSISTEGDRDTDASQSSWDRVSESLATQSESQHNKQKPVSVTSKWHVYLDDVPLSESDDSEDDCMLAAIGNSSVVGVHVPGVCQD